MFTCCVAGCGSPSDTVTNRLLTPFPTRSTMKGGSWSPDGRHFALTVETAGRHDVSIVTPGGQPVVEPWLTGPAQEFSPAFSPDGRWIAYQSDESGRAEIYVQGYPTGDRLAVSVAGGRSPVWRRDGRELYFSDAAAQSLMAVSVAPEGASLRLGQPVALFDLSVRGATGLVERYDVGATAGAGYDVLPDGRFVMVLRADRVAREIVLVRRWLQGLTLDPDAR